MYKVIDVLEFLFYVLCWMYDVEDWAGYYELFNFSSKTIIVQ
jgi:hypothetical protein